MEFGVSGESEILPHMQGNGYAPISPEDSGTDTS